MMPKECSGGELEKKSRRYLEYTLKRSGKWVQGV